TPALHSFPTRRSSDLHTCAPFTRKGQPRRTHALATAPHDGFRELDRLDEVVLGIQMQQRHEPAIDPAGPGEIADSKCLVERQGRSEEHTSELQSLAYL